MHVSAGALRGQRHQMSRGAAITDGHEPLTQHGCWELNCGSLEEQYVFLATEPASLQPLMALINNVGGNTKWAGVLFAVFCQLHPS